MKKIFDTIKLISGVAAVCVFTLLSIPCILIIQPFLWAGNKVLKQKPALYLKKLNGKNFFCYSNKSIDFIEQELLPRLPNSVEVVFSNGSILETKYDKEFISKALHPLKDYNGFPHLIKVRNGRVSSESLNNQLYNTIRQNRPIEMLLTDIYRFLE